LLTISFRIAILFLLSLALFSPAIHAFDTLKVEASLDTLKKEISGVVEYRLPGNSGLHSFEFQLFPNVYSNQDSPYLRGNRQFLEHFLRDKKWAGMDIDSICLDGINQSSNLKIEYTKGILEVPGETELGGRLVQIYFKTRIPEFGDRLSYFKNQYLLDGWYPNPAILERDGSWYNPYYGPYCELVGEYYDFDVSLTLPANLVVAAAIPAADTIALGERVKYRFNFGPAHDFAMALSPDYLIDSTSIGSTILRIFYRDYEKSSLSAIREAARQSCEFMSVNVGKYQYSYLNYALVDFTFSGGLELPALIDLSSPKDAPMISHMYQSMIYHETAHQWFYGMIGSNQVEAPWMDEAVSNFFTDKIQVSVYGEKANLLDFADFKMSNGNLFRLVGGLSGRDGIINKPAYSFATQMDYFGLMYVSGALVVQTFDALLGDSLAAEFWHKYYERFLFKHPKPGDFFQLADEIGGENSRRLLEHLLNVTSRVDYSIESLNNSRIDSTEIEISLVLRKEGDIYYPARYLLVKSNGDTMNYVWNPEYDSEEIVIKSMEPVAEAIIDPDYKIAIDNDFLNNSMKVRGDGRPGLRLSSGIMFLIESLLSYGGGL